MTRTAYRLRLYAPRSVDATEATILTPRPGSDHSDPFQVATEQGVTGYQPYLVENPTGRRSSIDPLSKQTEIGSMTFKIGDKRLGTSNLIRWATAFAGDANGEDLYQGLRLECDEALDFDPANPTAATWNRWYTGRVVSPSLDGRLVLQLGSHEMTDDLNVNVFVGPPSTTVAGVTAYAQQAQLYPLGLVQKYGPFPVETTKVQATVTDTFATGWNARVNTSGVQRSSKNLVIAKVFGDLLNDPGGGPVVAQKARAVVKRLDTGVTSEWACVGGVRGSSLEALFVSSIPGVSPAAFPVNTSIEFTIKPVGMAVDDSLPLLIDDVHPVTFIKHLLQGAFCALKADGSPKSSVAIEPTSFAALEADPSFGTYRRIVRKSEKMNDAIEAVCRERHLAYRTDEFGRIVIVDLRRTSTLVPVAALTSADTDTGKTPEWNPDASQAITSVSVTYYQEEWTRDAELPEPFRPVPDEGYPDIAPIRIDDSTDRVVRVEQFGPRVGDVKGNDEAIDAHGLRFAIGVHEDFTLAYLPLIETVNGKSRLDAIEAYITAAASELRAPFSLGPTFVTVAFKKAAVSAVKPGHFVTYTIDEVPDPASNRRGGTRLALVTTRTEYGPVVELELLDAGANSTAVTPTIGAPTVNANDAGAVDVAVTLNAAGDPVHLQIALTSTAVGVAPSSGWIDVAPVTATGTTTIRRIGRDLRRVWVRGRSEPGGGQGFKLPSAYVAAGGGGFVDLTAIAAPTGLVVIDAGGYGNASWTPGSTTFREEVFITTGGVPGAWTDAMRVVRLDAGSIQWRVGPLTLGQTYTLGVCTIDDTGARSAFATATWVALSSPSLKVPTDATPFAGSQSASGMLLADGTYGLAVAAAEFPGEVEFQVAVETAPSSGLFGAFTSVGRVAAVQGDWTKIVLVAPNDNRKRRLTARTLHGTATSAFTDGVDVLPWTPLALPPYTLTITSEDLGDFKFTDSADGTKRTFTWTRGARVKAIYVYDILEQAPPQADPWPDSTDLPTVILRAGTDSYTVTKPTVGFQRFVQIEPRLDDFTDGTVHRVIVDPAPSAMAPKISAIVANGVADLVATVVAGVSDWPVTARVFEDDPTSVPIVETVLTANATLDKVSTPALGGRSRPNGRAWWLSLTDASGETAWANTASPANAPTIKSRVSKSTLGDTEDAYAIVDSIGGEPLRLFVRDTEDTAAPVYGLVVGAADTTPRFVAAGTELGPLDYFYSGSGSPVQKLAAIQLSRDQVLRRYLQAQGKNTGLVSTWVPVTLSLKDVPFLESFSLEWDEATGKLRARIVGGAKCQSCLLAVSQNADLSSPATTTSAITDGNEIVLLTTLSGAQRGKTWYASVTPYNGPLVAGAPTGLAGSPAKNECAVPRNFTLTSAATQNPSAGTATLTLTVGDAGLVIDQTQKIKFYVTVEGVRTLTAPTSAPAGTTGNFVMTVNVALETKVEPVVFYADGTSAILGAWSFVANVAPSNATIAIDPIAGNTAGQASVSFRADGPANASSCRYQLVTGSAPTQPLDATVAASGTALSGRIWSVLNAATVSRGDIAELVIVPFTGPLVGGVPTGTQLPSIHVRAAYTTYGKQKTVTYAMSNWKESISPGWGILWNGALEPTNPAIPGGAGARTFRLALELPLAPGTKVHQVDINAGWTTTANPWVSFDTWVRINNVLQSTVAATPNSTFQTITHGLPDILVTGSFRVDAIMGIVGAAVDASNGILREVTVTYIMPSDDKTL